MILNAHAGTKYGVSFPVLCRASFGVKGANVPAILRALVACGWFGIQTWIGGARAEHAAGRGVARRGRGLPGSVWIAFAIFWLVQVAIIVRGLEGIKMLESWSAPLLLGGGVLLLWLGDRRGGGLGRILGESARLQTAQTPFWQLFPGRAHRQRRLLGDAQPEHPRLHALRAQPALAGARPGARPADDDDGVRVHRRGGDERDDRRSSARRSGIRWC